MTMTYHSYPPAIIRHRDLIMETATVPRPPSPAPTPQLATLVQALDRYFRLGRDRGYGWQTTPDLDEAWLAVVRAYQALEAVRAVTERLLAPAAAGVAPEHAEQEQQS